MPYKSKELKAGIKGFNRNPSTGILSVVDKNNVKRQISFIGYNDIYVNSVTNFFDTTANKPNSYSNPAWTEYKLLGYGNHNDPRYPNPIRANCRRMYLNSAEGNVSIPSSGISRNNGHYLTEDRKDFLLYVGKKTGGGANKSLHELNITFDDVTLVTVAMTWTSAMTTANGSNDVLKLNEYRPKLILEGSNGLAFQRGGRLLAIEAGNQSFPELLGNSTAGIVMTINSNGAGLKVNGTAQSTYVINGNADSSQTFLQVARYAGQTYRISDAGASLKVTNKNKGAFWNTATLSDNQYIAYNGGYPNDYTTDSFDGGQIYARPAENRLKLIKTGTSQEYYSDYGESFTGDEFNRIYDIHCIKPTQFCPKDCRTISGTFNSASVFQVHHYAEGQEGSEPYYDYDYEKNFSTGSDKKQGLDMNIISDQSLLSQIRQANKYGVWTILNAFWSFTNYQYSIYGGTAAEQKIKKSEAQQKYIDMIMQKVGIVIDEFDYCPLILGNETNLDSNLKGNLNGDYIFFADQANQNKQANVNAMMKFFNDIAGQLHAVFGEKVMVGPCIQLGSQGQCDEIITALNAGYGSNFDILFNNYYGHGVETDPQINYDDFNAHAYYKANRGSNKLNIILSECGAGSLKVDINDMPNDYPAKGKQGYTPPANINYGTPAEKTRTEEVQANVDRNMIIKFLKDTALNDVVQGVILFGDMNQPHRSSFVAGYGVAEYASFFNPPSIPSGTTPTQVTADIRVHINTFRNATNANPNITGPAIGIPRGKLALFEEKGSSHLWRDTPRQFNPSGNDYQATAFMPTLAQLQTMELPAMGALRAEIALGVPNLIYANEV